GGCDRRGRGPALPRNYDDTLRRDLRHTADRAWHRRRCRAAPAARNRGGWRSAAFAAVDALHHAGDLPLSRSLRSAAKAPARTTACGSKRSSSGGCGRITATSHNIQGRKHPGSGGVYRLGLSAFSISEIADKLTVTG